MLCHLIRLTMTILVIGQYSVLTTDIRLTQLEDNLLYARLNTQSDLRSYYAKLLQSNGIDDRTRLHHVITQDDLRQFDLEHKVEGSFETIAHKFPA